MKIIDMTITYENGMTGQSAYHPVVELRRLAKLEEVGRNTSSILLGSHIGTHMDSPNHFIAGGDTIDQVNLGDCMGDVTIVNVRHRKKGDCLRPEDLDGCSLKPRVILDFGWGGKAKTQEYLNGYPFISEEAAERLLKGGVRLVAMDTPSPDPIPDGGPMDFAVHRKMLKEGVIFVEGLIHLEQIRYGSAYTFLALPLKLEGTDASPCRAVLIEKEE